MLKKFKTGQVARCAAIAAIYAVSTLVFAPIGFVLRISEALTVLPIIIDEAPYGLFAGCVLANLLSGYGVYDVIFGSLASLLAGLATRRLARRPLFALMPPVVINSVIVGLVISFATGIPFIAAAAEVGAAQLISCYGLGLPLYYAIKANPRILNMLRSDK